MKTILDALTTRRFIIDASHLFNQYSIRFIEMVSIAFGGMHHLADICAHMAVYNIDKYNLPTEVVGVLEHSRLPVDKVLDFMQHFSDTLSINLIPFIQTHHSFPHFNIQDCYHEQRYYEKSDWLETIFRLVVNIYDSPNVRTLPISLRIPRSPSLSNYA